eukprot:TRINITY_DN2661_c1_g2_i5.p2 TRINITY_DN2661_c1_g2~~TRINITY_DN2661_c1_g2_i5.p2  ORF type:complete len:203 (+),score=91.76 TRINITY_DN2661_c1_g2_i5:986-1594(+)
MSDFLPSHLAEHITSFQPAPLLDVEEHPDQQQDQQDQQDDQEQQQQQQQPEQYDDQLQESPNKMQRLNESFGDVSFGADMSMNDFPLDAGFDAPTFDINDDWASTLNQSSSSSSSDSSIASVDQDETTVVNRYIPIFEQQISSSGGAISFDKFVENTTPAHVDSKRKNAAASFYAMLACATKNKLAVKQQTGFGEIRIEMAV